MITEKLKKGDRIQTPWTSANNGIRTVTEVFEVGPIGQKEMYVLFDTGTQQDLETIMLECTLLSAEPPGVKFDSGKAPYDLLPFKALASVVDVLGYGAKKYAPENWRKVPDLRRRYFAAAFRHIVAWWYGAKNDKESGLPHLAHALCCVMFLLETELENEKAT